MAKKLFSQSQNIIIKEKPFSPFSFIRNPDFFMAALVVGSVLMMIFPLPVFFIDLLMAISISAALIVLMVSIYITKPLEFGVFPTLLLISTLFRLSLNVATTRNILLHGADGEVAKLVVAFGHVVVGGNFVVGFVIFCYFNGYKFYCDHKRCRSCC